MVENSRMESSMSHMVNEADVTQIGATTSDLNHNRENTAADGFIHGHSQPFNPLKGLKKNLVKASNYEDRPNRRGKQNLQVPVKLHISGRNLKNMDIFSKSDPLCVVFEKAQDREQWFEIGRTEFIKDSLNPDFEKSIDIDFFFEKNQMLRFEFIDDDGGDSEDPYYDIIGAAITSLPAIMASKGQTITKPILVPGKRKQRGMVIVRAESIKESNHQVQFQISSVGLENKAPTFFGLCSFYGQTVYEIQRASLQHQNIFQKVFRSEPVKGNTAIKFKKVKLQMQQLCNSNESIPIRFRIFANNHETCSGTTSVAELRAKPELAMYSIKSGQFAGALKFNDFKVVENPNFVDYLRSGWQVSLSVAIDFTASNGQVTDPTSLHSLNEKNEYSNAIRQVGDILEPYDQYKSFPCFGFGGVPRFMNECQTSHAFPLNGNFQEPEIWGIDGILDVYKRNMRGIHMAGPTFFSSIMDVFMDFATEGRELQTYFVLLILTDGEIHDMSETKKMIVEASKLPCSIIIVGVGCEEFPMMVELDSDDKLLRDDKNIKARRDIVQFVRFQEAIARGNLAEEVLKEIPTQVCRYMEMINYLPSKIDPDLRVINKTVIRQRDAMLAKQIRKQPGADSAQAFIAASGLQKKVAEGGPVKIVAGDEKTVNVKKRRRDRDQANRERESNSKTREGKSRRKSKDRRRERRRQRSKKRDQDDLAESEQQDAARRSSNALENLASTTLLQQKKANDRENLGEAKGI